MSTCFCLIHSRICMLRLFRTPKTLRPCRSKIERSVFWKTRDFSGSRTSSNFQRKSRCFITSLNSSSYGFSLTKFENMHDVQIRIFIFLHFHETFLLFRFLTYFMTRGFEAYKKYVPNGSVFSAEYALCCSAYHVYSKIDQRLHFLRCVCSCVPSSGDLS